MRPLAASPSPGRPASNASVEANDHECAAPLVHELDRVVDLGDLDSYVARIVERHRQHLSIRRAAIRAHDQATVTIPDDPVAPVVVGKQGTQVAAVA